MDKLQRISEVLQYIEDHLDEIADYEEVAKVFNFSPYYIHRLFSAVVGKPIATYIRERRLAKASELLTDPGKTITSLSLNAGSIHPRLFAGPSRTAMVFHRPITGGRVIPR